MPTIVYPEGLAESELGCLKLSNIVFKLEQVELNRHNGIVTIKPFSVLMFFNFTYLAVILPDPMAFLL